MGNKRKPKKIAIISRESDEKTLDVAMLEQELKSRGIHVKVLSKLLTKDKSVKNAVGYIGHALRQEAEILSSDVVVLDTYCIPASLLPHRKSTKIIQIWHALGAVKKFGWQTVGRADGTSERTARLMRMHHGYDYVVCPSEVTAEYYSEAFRVPKEKIVKLGLPRIDYIKKITHEESESTKEKILSRYPGLKNTNKKIVLYAPTFRRGQMPDVAGLTAALDPEEYNLLVKLHPLYGGGNIFFRDHIFYDESFSTYELLAVTDAVVSDYSALVIEATLAEKPLYLYIYDEVEYSKNTGLNMNLEEEAIGKYAFRKATDLVAALKEPYDLQALQEFRQKYIQVDENCTKALADFITVL